MFKLSFKPIQGAAGWVMLSALSAGIAQSSAFAAYSDPVTWADMSAMDLRPALKSPYASSGNLYEPAIPDSALLLVLKDADARISREFHVPSELLPAVTFWLRIYAEFTTQHVVIYDSRHPELVYEVLDFRELAATARNRVVYEIVSKKRVAKAIAAYRRAFARLARNPKPKAPTPEERNILAVLKKLPHKHSLRDLGDSLRTQTGQRDNIIKGLLAAETFFPKMEQLFLKTSVPLELTRLTLVESSFNLKAKSKAGAAGIWQFMPKSGKEFMLVDDRRSVDERLSPLKATVAAAKLLKRNKRILGHWALAVTSFNHGVRDLPRFGGKEAEFDDFAHLFDPCHKKGRRNEHFGYASRNYYAEFLAVVHAEAYRNLFYGEPPKPPIQEVAFRSVKAGRTALQIAKQRAIPWQEFQFYNPDILNPRQKLPQGFWVAIPGESDDLAGLTDGSTRSGKVRNI